MVNEQRYVLIRHTVTGKPRAIRTPSGVTAPWSDDAVVNELNTLTRRLGAVLRENAELREQLASIDTGARN